MSAKYPPYPDSGVASYPSSATLIDTSDSQYDSKTHGHAVAIDCVLSCLCFVYLSVIPFLFVFFYHAYPSTVLGVVAILFLSSFIPLFAHKGKHVVTELTGPMLTASMFACLTLSLLGSMYTYWNHVQPMRALMDGRIYNGVYPEQPSVGLADGAFLNFAGDATVDVEKATSIKTLERGLHTFCIAPITSFKETGRVEVWAVGVDCCGDAPKSKFECGDIDKADAKSAYVLQDPSDLLYDYVGKYIAPPIVRRDLFLTAVHKAELDNRILSTKEALLVRWTSLTREELIEVEWIQILGSCTFNAVCCAAMALILARLLHRYLYLHSVQRGLKRTLAQGAQRSIHDAWLGGRNESFRPPMMARAPTLMAHHGEALANTSEAFREFVATANAAKTRPPISLFFTVWYEIVTPYIVFLLAVILASYSGCWRHGTVIYATFISLVVVMIFVFVGMPHKHTHAAFMLLVALTGLYIGHWNYENNAFHACTVADGRGYVDVPASDASDKYTDAGTLTFDKEAYLSQELAVGFVQNQVTYCVAPILSRADDCTSATTTAAPKEEDSSAAAIEDSPAAVSLLQRSARRQVSLTRDQADNPAPTLQSTPTEAAQCSAKPRRVEFWAIGTNCCGDRKDFECDGGKDSTARSAVLVRPTGYEQPGGDRDQFMKAIQLSQAANKLYGDESPSPILIRWGKQPEQMRSDWSSKAMKNVVLSAILALLGFTSLGLGQYAYYKNLRQKEAQEQAEERARLQHARRESQDKMPSSSSLFNGFGFFDSGAARGHTPREEASRSQLSV